MAKDEIRTQNKIWIVTSIDEDPILLDENSEILKEGTKIQVLSNNPKVWIIFLDHQPPFKTKTISSIQRLLPKGSQKQLWIIFPIDILCSTSKTLSFSIPF